MGHSQVPWVVYNSDKDSIYSPTSGRLVADCDQSPDAQANAALIVECVNACARICSIDPGRVARSLPHIINELRWFLGAYPNEDHEHMHLARLALVRATGEDECGAPMSEADAEAWVKDTAEHST